MLNRLHYDGGMEDMIILFRLRFTYYATNFNNAIVL